MIRLKLITLILLTICLEADAQYGYIKLLENDSIITGYVREFRSHENGRNAIEVWRSKKDKNPLRFYKSDIIEYALKKDTFRILQNFQPFKDEKTYFDLTDALFISQGKINLLRIDFIVHNSNVGVSTDFIYILEERETKYMKAISRDDIKMKEQLLDFFSESYLDNYAQYKNRISYKTIPDIVKFYNSRT